MYYRHLSRALYCYFANWQLDNRAFVPLALSRFLIEERGDVTSRGCDVTRR